MSKEKTYKVIALSVGGANNNIYKSGDTVKESNFPVGNAEKLVKSGFLEEIEVEETPKQKALIDQFTAKELKELLSSKEIEFSNNATKAELYSALLGLLPEFDESTVDKAALLEALK